MPLYASFTSLQTLMVGMNLTTTSNLGSVTTMVIDRAERRINSVLARRYDLSTAYFQTTSSIPPQLREWATMLAQGYLWKESARAGAGKEAMARGEGLLKEVFADLKLLAAYELELVDTAGSLVPDMSETSYRVLCNTTNYVDTFDEGEENSWRVDPDKLEDIADTKD